MYKKILRFIWRVMTSVFVIFEDVPDSLVSLFDEVEKLNSYLLEKRKIILTIRNVVFVCWTGIAFLIMYSVVYIQSRSTFYVVSANVEQVTVSPYKDKSDPPEVNEYPVFKLSNVVLYDDCGDQGAEVSGTLIANSSSYIEFLRIQKDNFIISLDNDNEEPAGLFVHDDKSEKEKVLKDCAFIKIMVKENDSLVFPISGNIKLGGEIKHGTEVIPILYSGEVSIIDKAFLTDDYYTVGPFELEIGDVFRIDDAVITSSGFIQVDAEKGINVVYSSKGNKGYIKKYQTENIEIKNGLWTKIYNDQSLIVLWFFALFAFASCKAKIRINLTKLESMN